MHMHGAAQPAPQVNELAKALHHLTGIEQFSMHKQMDMLHMNEIERQRNVILEELTQGEDYPWVTHTADLIGPVLVPHPPHSRRHHQRADEKRQGHEHGQPRATLSQLSSQQRGETSRGVLCLSCMHGPRLPRPPRSRARPQVFIETLHLIRKLWEAKLAPHDHTTRNRMVVVLDRSARAERRQRGSPSPADYWMPRS